MADELTQVAQDSARGGFFLVSGTAVATFILAIASILIARFLGPELYGQYALALLLPQVLFLFTDLGITQGITRFTAALKSKGETNRIPSIIKHGLLIRALIGLGIFATNYALADQIATILLQRPELTFYIQIASIAILFQVVFTTTASAFVGLDKTEYQAIATNVQATAKTIVSISLIIAGLGVTGAIAGFTASYIVAAIATIPLLWKVIRKKKSDPSTSDLFKTNLKTLFQYGTPLYVSVLLAGFLPLFMNLMLAFFTTDIDIGNYKAAINFATLLTVLAVPVTTVLLPAFSKLQQTNSTKTRDFFQISLKFTTIIVMPVALLIMIFSREIVQIVYGQTYQTASLFLSTYCLVYFLVGIGYLTLPSLFNGLGETKTTMKIGIINFAILATLAAPLTQAFGVHGVIAAFLVANATGMLYGAQKAKTHLKIKYNIRGTAKIYLIAAASSAAPLLLNSLSILPGLLNLAAGGLLYIFTYLTLMPLTGVSTNSELQKSKLATQNTPILKQIINPILNYQQRIAQLKAKPNPPQKPKNQ
jgi:O-antigen/teichoic acid export membrane protein